MILLGGIFVGILVVIAVVVVIAIKNKDNF